jgi:hypothetical protein
VRKCGALSQDLEQLLRKVYCFSKKEVLSINIHFMNILLSNLTLKPLMKKHKHWSESYFAYS